MKLCEVCEQPFKGQRKTSRFCSVKCRGESDAKRWSGAGNPRFNGGMCIHKSRAIICCRDGSVLWYSRALMEAELRRPLRSDELVHHVNGDGSDDRVENLQIVTRAEHQRLHRREWAKLTLEKAREIKESPESLTTLARRFGISKSSAWAVRAGRTWRDA